MSLDTSEALPARPTAADYRFCKRCWLPIAPVRRCTCPPDELPSPEQIAATAQAHPGLYAIAAAVANGGYADDTATHEQRWLGFLAWLVARRKIGEQTVYTIEEVEHTDDGSD